MIINNNALLYTLILITLFFNTVLLYSNINNINNINTNTDADTNLNNNYNYNNSFNSYNQLAFLSLINKDWTQQSISLSPCPGFYSPEKIPQATKKEVSADNIKLAKDGESVLSGNVVYLDDKQLIRANEAIASRDSKIDQITSLKLNDNVEYLTPEFRVITNNAVADILNNTAFLNREIYYRYYPGHARGKASGAKLIKDKQYEVYNAEYTTCPPKEDAAWKIYTNKLIIYPSEERGVANDTTLYFYNIPIFYTPYLSFPTTNKRETGLLMPIVNKSDRYGFSYAQPYYLNLAPNYDMTLTPRYMTERSLQLITETRYLNKSGYNQINFEVLPDDDKFKRFRKRTIATPPVGITTNNPKYTNLLHANNTRYAIKVKDSRQWNRYLSSNINYHALSDNQYQIDIPLSETLRRENPDHLLQEGRINFDYKNWHAEGLAKGYQTLHTIDGPDLDEVYRILPGFSVSNNHINIYNSTIIPLNIIGSIESHAYRFAVPSNPKVNRISEGQRYFAKPAMTFDMSKTYGYIKPKVALSARYYDLNQITTATRTLNYSYSPDYYIPIFSIDSGLFFDRPFDFNNKKYNQTLEPRLFYLYIPHKNQNEAPDFDIKDTTISYDQLFRDNRFSGYDRQSNANQITAGITTKLQNYNTGFEIAKLQLGQAFYFQNLITTTCNRDINQNCIITETPDYKSRYSPFIALFNYNINENWYGQAEWQWDYFINKTRKVNFGFHYLYNTISKNQTIFNLEYNFLKEGNIQKTINGTRIFKVNDDHNNLSEIEASFKLPVHRYWNILGFSSYDINNSSSLNNYFGAEFQQCCWAIRVGYKSELRPRVNSFAKSKYDNIFTLQFSLKGLGEINDSFEHVLRNNIPGYKNSLIDIY